MEEEKRNIEFTINNKAYMVSNELTFEQFDQLNKIEGIDKIEIIPVGETSIKAENFNDVNFCRLAAIALVPKNAGRDTKNIDELEKELRHVDIDIVLEIVRVFITSKKKMESITTMMLTSIDIFAAMRSKEYQRITAPILEKMKAEEDTTQETPET